MTKIALVTGCAGFIGHNLVKELSKRDYDIIGVDLEADKMNTQFLGELDTELKFIRADCRQLDQIDYLIEMADIVYHLAGQTDVGSSIEDPLNDFEHNVIGSNNVIHSCMKNHIKMVFTSSFSVYGNLATSPIPESSELRPVSPYGMSKMIIEQLMSFYRRHYKFNGTILRLTNVYGFMDFKSVIYHFLTKNQDGQAVTVTGTGEQTRDFIFVQDAVDAIIESTKIRNGVYNIGTGKSTNLIGLLGIIQDNPAINFVKELKGDIRHSWADTSLTKKSMDWRPRYTVKAGMKRFDSWLKTVR